MTDPIAAELSNTALHVEPGAPPAQLLVSVRNQSDIVDEFDIRLQGIDPAWCTVEPASVRLFPEESAEARVQMTVPADAVGAMYPFQVVVSSRSDPSATLPLGGMLDVAPPLPGTVQLLLEPMRREARRSAVYTLAARSFGSSIERHVRLQASAADESVSLRITPAELLVSDAATATAAVQVRSRGLNWARPSMMRAFDVRAYDIEEPEDAAQPVAMVLGQFVQAPLLPFIAAVPLFGRRLALLAIPVLIALAALIWFLGASGLHTTPIAAPPTPTPLAVAAAAVPPPAPPAAAPVPTPAPAEEPTAEPAATPGPTQAPPEITHFGLNLDSSDPPQSVPLDWQVFAAADIHVAQATPTVIDDPASLEVQSAEYTLTADNDGGSSSESLTVYVLRPPVINDFEVVATESDGIIHLTWRAARADRVYFNDQLLDGDSGTLDIASDSTQPLVLRAENSVGQDVREIQPGQSAPAPTPTLANPTPGATLVVVSTPVVAAAAAPPSAPSGAPEAPAAENPPPPPTPSAPPTSTPVVAEDATPTVPPPPAATATPLLATAISTVPPTSVPTATDLPTHTPTPVRAAPAGPATPAPTAPPTATSTPVPGAPVIAVDVQPAPNPAGWNNTPPTVTWTVTDSTSPIASTTGCDPTTVSTQTAGATLTCSATNAAGLTTTRTVTVDLDTAPPAVAFGTPIPARPTPEGATPGWFNSDVSIPFQVTDNLSGVATVTPSSGMVSLSQEGANVTGTVTAVDNAGNPVTVTSPAVHIDKTPPQIKVPSTITVTAGPTPGPVNYTVTTTDNLDPNPTLTCAPASGSAFQVGTTTVTCVAFDLARNTTTSTFNVVVLPPPTPTPVLFTLTLVVSQPPPNFGFSGTPTPVAPVTIGVSGQSSCQSGKTCTYSIVQGTSVTITSPIAFPAWSGCDSNNGTFTTCTVSMTGARTVNLDLQGG